MSLIYLKEAAKMLSRARHKQFYRYAGSCKNICREIVKDCYNGKYFQVSAGHFDDFYIRDFSWVVESLMKLGYKKQVHETLKHSLTIYSKKHVSTTITKDNKAVDFFTYAADSLPSLLRCLRIAEFDINQYKMFLEYEAQYYFNKVFDTKTGLIKKDKAFSSIKDHYRRPCSTYDNCMLAMLKNDLTYFKLKNPFSGYDIRTNIKKQLWNGSFFLDHIGADNYVAADANIFPYWTKVFTDKRMLHSSIAAIQREKLDYPFPLKYTAIPTKKNQFFLPPKLAPNYEGNTIWMHLAIIYLQIVEQHDHKLFNKYTNQLVQLVDKHRTFLELYNQDGSPYKTFLYKTDEAISWCAVLLEILEKK